VMFNYLIIEAWERVGTDGMEVKVERGGLCGKQSGLIVIGLSFLGPQDITLLQKAET
jgi:hypothetical protein